MAQQIQTRRDTAANWTTADPTLASGEIGFETDTYKFKIGDGITAWTSLAYFGGSGHTITENTTPRNPRANLDFDGTNLTATDNPSNDATDIDLSTTLKTNLTDLTDGGETTLHIHDTRYYTETELDGFLAGKEDVDATIIRQADVDDIPVDTATNVPVSSNWAFDHAAVHAPSNADNTAANETYGSDAEVETAYNNQVDIVGQTEAETGTATTVRRWTAQRVKQAIQKISEVLSSSVADAASAVAFIRDTDNALPTKGALHTSYRVNGTEVAHVDNLGKLECWGFSYGDLLGIAFWIEVNEKIIFLDETTWGASNDMIMNYDSGNKRGEWYCTRSFAADLRIGGQLAEYASGQHVAGAIEIFGTDAGAGATGTSQKGGNISILAGDGAVNGDGGDLTLEAGPKAGTGTAGNILMTSLPTSDPGVTGALWNDSGTLKIS